MGEEICCEEEFKPQRLLSETEGVMKIRKKMFADFEYEEVLDTKTRELIRVACAVAVGCPT